MIPRSFVKIKELPQKKDIKPGNGICKEFDSHIKENQDVNIMSKVFQNIFNLMVQDDEIELKNEFKELYFINKYKDSFYVS